MAQRRRRARNPEKHTSALSFAPNAKAVRINEKLWIDRRDSYDMLCLTQVRPQARCGSTGIAAVNTCGVVG